MRARAHMAQVLEGTGLYSLTGSTPVDWELDAYSAGFAPLEAAFDKLLADLFAATATRERLAQWEALDAYPRSFEAWDGLGLTWAQLDGVSRQDLENGFEEV